MTDEHGSPSGAYSVRPEFSGPVFLIRFLAVHSLVAVVVFQVWEGARWMALVAGLLCLLAVFVPVPGSRSRGGVPVQVRTREGGFPAPSGRLHVRRDEVWLEARVFVGWPLASAWFSVPTLTVAALVAVYYGSSDAPAAFPFVNVAFVLVVSFLMQQSSCGAFRLVVPNASVERARRDGAHLKLMVRVAATDGGRDEDEIYVESSVARVVFLLEHLDAAGVEVEPGKPFGT